MNELRITIDELRITIDDLLNSFLTFLNRKLGFVIRKSLLKRVFFFKIGSVMLPAVEPLHPAKIKAKPFHLIDNL